MEELISRFWFLREFFPPSKSIHVLFVYAVKRRSSEKKTWGSHEADNIQVKNQVLLFFFFCTLNHIRECFVVFLTHQWQQDMVLAAVTKPISCEQPWSYKPKTGSSLYKQLKWPLKLDRVGSALCCQREGHMTGLKEKFTHTLKFSHYLLTPMTTERQGLKFLVPQNISAATSQWNGLSASF